LVPDPKQVDVLARQIVKQEGEFVLGLSWASTAPRVGEHKSIQLKELAPLFDIPNLKVVNLQYGKEKEQIADFEKDTGKKIIQTTVNTFFDLEGVAAMMRCCDAVVSVSNANVHLAAAMGTPVLMLDANKLWYWNGKDGNRSLWYPSLQMFNRESMVAPWDKQVSDLVLALKEMIK
jgi:ADP-heptose:LPS heptosyltransferase